MAFSEGIPRFHTGPWGCPIRVWVSPLFWEVPRLISSLLCRKSKAELRQFSWEPGCLQSRSVEAIHRPSEKSLPWRPWAQPKTKSVATQARLKTSFQSVQDNTAPNFAFQKVLLCRSKTDAASMLSDGVFPSNALIQRQWDKPLPDRILMGALCGCPRPWWYCSRWAAHWWALYSMPMLPLCWGIPQVLEVLGPSYAHLSWAGSPEPQRLWGNEFLGCARDLPSYDAASSWQLPCLACCSCSACSSPVTPIWASNVFCVAKTTS